MNPSTPDASVSRSPAGRAAWITLILAWVCFLVPFPGLGMFIGWPLNLVAFILAIVAMGAGGAMKGLLQLLGSLIVSPIIYFIGLALFGWLLSKDSYNDYTQRAASVQQVQAAPLAHATGQAHRAP